jgi:predicted ArsR family transcriptional regulator
MAEDHKETLDVARERVLRHPVRRRILLGLHAEGPLSPNELSKSRIGRGIPTRKYDFHLKQLIRFGLVEAVDGARGDGRGIRYTVTERLSQALLDAAALAAVSEVLASIPSELAKWVDQPYIDDISELVRASGRKGEDQSLASKRRIGAMEGRNK